MMASSKSSLDFQNRTPVTVILGPSGSGKSAFAEGLLNSKAIPTVSCDSVHAYRDLFIGSTRPSFSELERVPTFGVASLSLHEKANASEFNRGARAFTQLHQEALVLVGSPFYFQSVTFGLAPVAAHPPALTESRSISEMYEDLLQADPELVRVIKPRDHYRIQRAWWAMQSTGKRWSELQRSRESFLPWLAARKFYLSWNYAELRTRIEQRTNSMLESGWIEEVRSLLEHHDPKSPGLQTIGYREVVDYCLGTIDSMSQLKQKINQRTWQLARKQMTFFRSLSRKMELIPIPGKWAVSEMGREWLSGYWTLPVQGNEVESIFASSSEPLQPGLHLP